MNLKTYLSDSEKNLLLVNLCSYLPYGLKCLYCDADNEVKIGDLKAVHYNDNRIIIDNVSIDYSGCEMLGVIPYLLPMSSMSEEQINELKDLCDMYDPVDDTDDYEEWGVRLITKHFMDDGHHYHFKFNFPLFEFLNKNRFDYCGLIPKGLAINAKGLDIYINTVK